MKRTKSFWIAAGSILVLGAAGFYWIENSSGSKITYRTEKVDRGDVVVSISATGTLNAVTTVQVGSQVSGTIAKLYVDFNDEVKEGQLIAQLDPTFLRASVSEQRANVERAKAQVQEARRNMDRTSELFAKQLVSQADMDAATTALESASASLKQAEAALERAEVNLRYATIRAPISGVVISRDVDVGQTVAASLQAPTLFTIANDLRKMQVEASIDEADIGNVKVGQHVTFRVDAYPQDVFEGVVSQVRLKPITTQGVVTYVVIIAVDNPQQKLMPGMTATVTIEVEKREDVLRVPLLALRFTPPEDVMKTAEAELQASGEGDTTTQRRFARGGGAGQGGGQMRQGEGGGQRRFPRDASQVARVWVMADGKIKPVMVRRGIQDSRYAEVMGERLKEGDEVIVGSTGGSAQATTSGQTNPFMPQMPRGSRRGF